MVKGWLQKGYNYHQAGNLAAAAQLYQKLLKKQPEHADTNFLLGTLNLQQGNHDTAATFLRKAIKLKPDNVVAHNNLGTALQEQGKLDEAVATYNQAIAINPDYADVYFNLGNTFKKQDKFYEAIESYRCVIALKSDDAEVHFNLGNTLQEHGKYDEAVKTYRQVLKLRPDYVIAHNNLATALQELGRLDEAIASFIQAIKLKPNYVEAHYNLGNTLKKQGKFDEAVKYCKRAIKLKPDDATAHNNLGVILQEQGKLDEAVACCRRAIALKPDDATSHNNLAVALQDQGKLDKAVESYSRAIELRPEYVEAYRNRSLALLLTESFEDGWPEYEWRLLTKDCTSNVFQQPRWDGTPLKGKSILVHAEQGLGDTIQFVRYLPMVHAQGGHVIFECQQVLSRLLKKCTGFDEIIEHKANRKPAAHFNFHIPLLSLPGIFGTTLQTIPSDVPYISVDHELVAQWRMRLDQDDTFKVGLVWAGNPRHRNDRNRSCSLTDLAPLADIPGLTFYSLQKGPASVEILNSPKGMKIIDLENDLSDFADTAAAISNLDLVIAVDTAVVHLAGAIGKQVWVLLPFAPDWRWLLNRDDSPWYPDVRLFRQTRPKDWGGVFEQIRKALLQEVVDLGLRIAV
ncbi:MAG: tetratricopeptide repeat protein [Candidatus Scalinduaceae bacterium]